MSDPFQSPSPFQPQPGYQQQPGQPSLQQQQPTSQQPPQYQQTPQYQQAPPQYQQQGPYQQQPTGQPMAGQSGLSDNAAGGLAYVTFVPAIIFLMLEPYNKSSYIRFHSWQSIFLTIAAAIAWAVLMVIAFIPVLNLVDVVLSPLVWLGFFVLWIILLVKAISGARFKLPIIGELAEKQANS